METFKEFTVRREMERKLNLPGRLSRKNRNKVVAKIQRAKAREVEEWEREYYEEKSKRRLSRIE